MFGKGADGRRHWLAWLVLWPYLVLASMTLHIIRLVSREPPLDEMDDDIWLSRRLLPNELPSHVNSVVDLTCELSETELYTASQALSLLSDAGRCRRRP